MVICITKSDCLLSNDIKIYKFRFKKLFLEWKSIVISFQLIKLSKYIRLKKRRLRLV